MCAVFGWAPIARTVNGLRSLAGAHLPNRTGTRYSRAATGALGLAERCWLQSREGDLARKPAQQ